MRFGILYLMAFATLAANAAPAAAQFSGSATPAKERGYVADTSAMPAQAVLGCYAMLMAGDAHPDVKVKDEDVTRPLVRALEARLEAEIKKAGRSDTIASLAGPMRAQMLQRWNLGEFFKMRDQCGVAADDGLVKFRSTPGAGDAFSCWAFLANRAPNDPDAAFLLFDIRAAFDRDKVYFRSAARSIDKFKEEVGAMLAGPQGAQLATRFAGCAAKVRPALRQIAYMPAPAVVAMDSYLAEALRQEMDLKALAGIPTSQGIGKTYWTVPADGWTRWVGSIEAGNALACMREAPLREGRPAGALAPADLAERALAEAGLTPRDTAIVITAAASDHNTFSSIDGIDAACKIWGASAAKRYGAAFFRGVDLD